MFCPKCGTDNGNNNSYCTQCGRLLSGKNVEVINNNLVLAILATIFCCMPAGIVSIVYAAQVNEKIALNDIEGARLASQNAKTWAWVSIAVTGVVILAYFIIIMFSSFGTFFR